jgi:hypothetical protein
MIRAKKTPSRFYKKKHDNLHAETEKVKAARVGNARKAGNLRLPEEAAPPLRRILASQRRKMGITALSSVP